MFRGLYLTTMWIMSYSVLVRTIVQVVSPITFLDALRTCDTE
jgi:hypothetical protein